jgi:uncharacterized protein YjbJ (UPF0337 family)
MNKDIIEGKWNEVKGQVKAKWGKLTDSDIVQINGKKEILVGKLQAHYGYAKDRAEEELKIFVKAFEHSPSANVSGSQKDLARAGKAPAAANSRDNFKNTSR